MLVKRETMSDSAIDSSQSQQYLPVNIRNICAGVTIEFPIFDNDKVLLLGKGQIVTEPFIKKLLERNVTSIIVHASEVARLTAGKSQGNSESVPADRSGQVSSERNAYSDQLDVMIQKSQALGIQNEGAPFAASVQSPGTGQYDKQLIAEFTKQHSESVSFMQESFAEMVNDEGVNLSGLKDTGEVALNQLVRDPDLYASLGINPKSDSYPARHCSHVSKVATLIGMRMGLDKRMLHNLAIGCLIHDAGMLRINRAVYEKKAKLNSVEFLEITKHPVAVFEILKTVRSLETPVAMVAYQMHERCNGTGYPRGCRGNKIHPLAKIAMVADVFVALVSDRPHHPSLLPYKAMEKLLLDGNKGLYDNQVVRTLLECISLFPISSYVELSDRRIGKVIRSTGSTFSQPILEVWQPYKTSVEPQVVNLTEETALNVVRPLSPNDERLVQTKIESPVPPSETAHHVEATELADNWD